MLSTAWQTDHASQRGLLLALAGVHNSAMFKSPGHLFVFQISPSYIPINGDLGPLRCSQINCLAPCSLNILFSLTMCIPCPELTYLSHAAFLPTPGSRPGAPDLQACMKGRSMHVCGVDVHSKKVPLQAPTPPLGATTPHVSQETGKHFLCVSVWVPLKNVDAAPSSSP